MLYQPGDLTKNEYRKLHLFFQFSNMSCKEANLKQPPHPDQNGSSSKRKFPSLSGGNKDNKTSNYQTVLGYAVVSLYTQGGWLLPEGSTLSIIPGTYMYTHTFTHTHTQRERERERERVIRVIRIIRGGVIKTINKL